MFSSRHINVAIFSLSDLKTLPFSMSSLPLPLDTANEGTEWGGLSQTKQGHCKPTYKLPVC